MGVRCTRGRSLRAILHSTEGKRESLVVIGRAVARIAQRAITITSVLWEWSREVFKANQEVAVQQSRETGVVLTQCFTLASQAW